MRQLHTTICSKVQDIIGELPSRFRSLNRREDSSGAFQADQLKEGSIVSLFRYSLDRQVQPLDDGFCRQLTGHSIEGLLGSSNVNPDGYEPKTRSYKRPLWRETEAVMRAVKRDLVAYSLPELAEMTLADIPQFLRAVGAETLPLKDVWLGYYVYETTYRSLSLNAAVPEELASRARQACMAALVTRELVYAICLAERLFGPNDLGYVADQTCSLVRLEEIKFERIETWVLPCVQEQPNLLGAETKDLVNNVIDRIEKTRERLSDGSTAIPKPLPRLV